MLFQAHVNVNAADVNGATPMFAAVMANRSAIVDLLIENGADVNAKTKDGRTALDDAVKFNRAEIARTLREKGATGAQAGG